MSTIKKSTVTTLCMIMVGLFLAVGCKKDKKEKMECPTDIPVMEYSIWKCTEYEDIIIELTFYPLENKLHIRSTPEDISETNYMIGGNIVVKYCIKNDRMYLALEDSDFFSNPNSFWIITYSSENEMLMKYGGILPQGGPMGFYVIMYQFICQTNFNGI